MLKVGIIGYCKEVLLLSEAINYSKFYITAIYDPTLVIGNLDGKLKEVFVSSINNLIDKVDVVIVTSESNFYFSWIEDCLRASKHIFINSVSQFSDYEIKQLVKLKDEANVIVQIRHDFMHANVFQEIFAKKRQTLLYDSSFTGVCINGLLISMREEISAAVLIMDSNIRKVQANVMSSFSDNPDILNVQLDFDNGSLAKLHVNSVEKKPEHKLKVYKYDSYMFADLIANSLEYCSNKEDADFSEDFMNETNIIRKQLSEFYANVKKQTLPIHGIDNENYINSIIIQVKQKIKLSLSTV